MAQTKLIPHINHALVPKTHTSMYLMHKYWARKPHNVVREYIDHYSKPDDIVLDPFVGSGVTAIEALKAHRKAIAVDLDPMSIFITRMTAAPSDLKVYYDAFQKIQGKVRHTIDSFYETRCPLCHKPAISEAIIWLDNKPVSIRYSCTCKKGSLWKKVTPSDAKNITQVEKTAIKQWFPKNELVWNTRVNVKKGTMVADLFTRRNLHALAIILDAIENIQDQRTKDLLKFTFTSSLGQASKLVFVIRRRGRSRGAKASENAEVGSWATRGYWVPPEFFEINAWNCFEERFKKIYRGKAESNKSISEYNEAKSFDDLSKDANIYAKVTSALRLSEIIPENSVDYVFTDPPYGDSVPYLELDLMWSSWLGFEVDFDDEIIISDSPVRREKNFELYHHMLCAAFSQIYKVLKSDRYLTVTFHNTDIQIYNSIISAVILAGFDLEKIVYQPPARTSPKGLLAPYGSAIGDYYIRFKKPLHERAGLSEQEIDKERYSRIIVEAVKRIIAERGEPTPYSLIVNSYSEIYARLKDAGYLFSAPQTIEEILRDELGKDFILIDNKWWFKDPESVPYLERVPLNERVEKTVINVLNRKIKASFDDILSEIFIQFPNALTPEVQSVTSVLREYAEPTKDGMWRLKPVVKSRESEHDTMVRLLAEVGQKAGFAVYADLEGWRQTEIPIHIPPENLSRIKEIDVIWFNKSQATHEFEVENTTGITEAIVRGSNLVSNAIGRYVVIPEERESLLSRKIVEPALAERVKKDNWNFLRYGDVQSFYAENKRKRTINIKNLELLAHFPRMKKIRQSNFDEYIRER